MGGDITRVLCFIVFLSLVTIGKVSSSFDPRCPLKTIKIVQAPTGKIAGCAKEWKVNITNSCDCNPFDVHLHCPKFDSVLITNDDHHTITEVTKRSGDCVLNEGRSLSIHGDDEALVFTYVGDRIDFAVSAYSAACS